MKKIVRFYEYERKSLSTLPIKGKDLDHLAKLSDSVFENERIFDIGRDHITSQHFVGVLSFGAYQVEVLPKLLANVRDDNHAAQNKILKNLMYMLSYTHNLDVSENEVASLSKTLDSFLEVYINIFSRRLQALLKRNFPRKYIREEQNLCCVKGKILFSDHVRHNLINQHQVYCQFDEFSEDNEISRIFKYVVQKLLLLTGDYDSRNRLKALGRLLAHVKDEIITPSKVNNIHLTRSSEQYEAVFNMAKMFINKFRTDFAGARTSDVAILFNMNELFEEFVFEFLKRNKTELGIKDLKPQKRKRLVQSHRDLGEKHFSGRSMFNTFADILIIFINDSEYVVDRIVIDTKYKILRSDGHHFHIKNSDAYQVLAYQAVHRQGENIPAVALLYPEADIPINKEFLVSDIGGVSFFTLSINLKEDLRYSRPEMLECFREYFAKIRGIESDSRTA